MNSPRGTKSDRPNTANSLVNAYNTLLAGKLATRDFIHEKVPTLYSVRLRRACFGEVEHNMKKTEYGRHLRLYEAPPLRRQRDSDIGFRAFPSSTNGYRDTSIIA